MDNPITNERLFRNLEIAGVFVIFALACFLHFFYDLTGKSVLGALFGSVNESVWEHLKIFAVAYTAWGFVELVWARVPLRCFTVAKTAGVYVLLLSITAFFYLYSSVIGKTFPAVDIPASFVFTALSEFVSFKLVENCEKLDEFFYTAVMLLFLLFAALLCLSYYPPKIFLFKDPVTGTYGVLSNNNIDV